MTTVAPTSILVFALLALAASTAANWRRSGAEARRAPKWLPGLGWAGLALSLVGYLGSLGWPRALPWWGLAAGLTAASVTTWLSLFPKTAQHTVATAGACALLLSAAAAGGWV